MDVPIFLSADFANQGDSGKLNVLGIFNRINVNKLPARHKSLYLVIRLALEYGEFDIEHDIRVLFIDQDGEELGEQSGKLTVARPESAGVTFADIVLNIDGLVIKRAGSHEFRLIINRDTKSTIPIDVVQINNETAGD